jgi:hypothetical protein
MDESTKRPECFADLQIVFPKRQDGLRVTPISCLQCRHKTECLRAAMRRKEGLTIREEMIDNAYRSGIVGFFNRWSQKKAIHRLKQKRD